MKDMCIKTSELTFFSCSLARCPLYEVGAGGHGALAGAGKVKLRSTGKYDWKRGAGHAGLLSQLEPLTESDWGPNGGFTNGNYKCCTL